MTPADPSAGTANLARLPLAITAVILGVIVLSLPVANRQVGVVPGFSPAWCAILFVCDLLTVLLLVSQYTAGGGARLLALSAAFLWNAVMIAFYALTVPDLFVATPALAADPNGIQWLWLSRHLVPPLLIGLALAPWERHLRWVSRRGLLAAAGLVAVVALAIVLGLVVVQYGASLPLLRDTVGHYRPAVVAILLLIDVAALATAVSGVVARRATRSLEAWAVVAAVACLGDVLLTLVYADRWSVAYFLARALGLAATMIVLVALLRQIVRLQQQAKEDAERLEHQNLALVEAQSLRDHLIAVVSHDLRTPLAGLLGYLEILGSDTPVEPSHLDRMHERSWLLARRLTLLTEDLLAVATLEHRDLVIVPEELDLADQLAETAAVFPDLDVVVDCSPGLVLEADPLRFQQVLGNLVRNSQKHGLPPVRLSGAATAGGLTITVSDDGPGIEPDLVPQVFERYTRGATSGTDGSGLGLSVVRDLVRSHHGTVGYDLQANTFVIFLPTPSPLSASQNGSRRGAERAEVTLS